MKPPTDADGRRTTENGRRNSGVETNIDFTERKWLSASRFFRSFSYTEKVHFLTAWEYMRTQNYAAACVVDVGFGTGRLIEQLYRRAGEGIPEQRDSPGRALREGSLPVPVSPLKEDQRPTIVGLDISERNVALFNGRVPQPDRERLQARTMSPHDSILPFDDAAIDYVLCSHVLEHVPDDRRLLDEIYRVLKTGGSMLLLVPIREEHLAVPTHLRKYTTANLVALLSDRFEILLSLENDAFTTLLRAWSVRNRAAFTLLKRVLIFALSLVPERLVLPFDSLAQRIGLLPSQFFVVARKR